MIEINIQDKNEEIFQMIKAFVENNSCKKIVFYTEGDIETITKNESFNEKNEIRDILLDIGYPANIFGYNYTIDAVLMYLQNGIKKCFTSNIYPEIAEKYKTSPSNVERSIRHGIEISCIRGNLEIIQKIFGYTISAKKGKPTNSEFISMLSEEILRRRELHK